MVEKIHSGKICNDTQVTNVLGYIGIDTVLGGTCLYAVHPIVQIIQITNFNVNIVHNAQKMMNPVVWRDYNTVSKSANKNR